MGKVQSLWRQNTLCFFSLIVFALHSRLLIFTKNIHEILLVPSLREAEVIFFSPLFDDEMIHGIGDQEVK